MARQIKDEHWLKQQLVAALHWDDEIVESVMQLLLNAASPVEVQDITSAYMEDNPVAVSAISDFMEARTSRQQPQQQLPQQRQQQQQQQGPPPTVQPWQQGQQQQQQQQKSRTAGSGSSYSASVAAPPTVPPKQQAAAAKKEKEKWLNLGGQQAPVDGSSSSTAQPTEQLSSKQQAEATLAMFKRGGRIASRPQPSSTAAAAGGAAGAGAGAGAGGGGGGSSGGSGSRRNKGEQLDSITAKLERKVANCLSCGKIFDCRNVMSNDIIRFIDSGFKCTFCGAAVAMTQQQRIQQAQQHQQQQQQQQQPAEGSNDGSTTLDAAAAAAADAQAQAIAFKDRLVEYDRHAQQRTTVIDDQSDFFEIDTNAWLTEEEREELRRRAQLEEEAAEARRNKVTVTLDLLGRKVVMTDAPGDPGAAAGGAGASFELRGEAVGSATQQLLQQVQAAAAASGGTGSCSSSKKASEQTLAASSQAASAEALAHAFAAISDLRISVTPNLATPPPVFLPARLQQQQQHAKPQQDAKGAPAAAAHKQQKKQQKAKQGGQQLRQQGKQHGDAGRAKQPQRQQRISAMVSRAAAVDGRVQDDSVFGDFETELLCDELLQKQPRSVTARVSNVSVTTGL